MVLHGHKFGFFNKLFKLLLILILFNILSKISIVFASNNFLGLNTRGIIIMWVELFILASFVITWLINLKIIRYYRTSIIGRPFIYILIGLTFLAASRIYILLFNLHIYELDETTLQFGWHIMYFSGMITFLISINNFDKRRYDDELQGFQKNDLLVILFLSIINILTYFFTISHNKVISNILVGSIFDKTGSVHFIAFILTGYLAFKLLKIKTTSTKDELGRLLVSFIPFFLIFLSLMTLNHFWELITESWGILGLNHDVIETVEQLFWIPGFLVTFIGLKRVHTISINSILYSETQLAIKLSEKNSRLILYILEIMSHHVGSSAMNIAIKSSEDIGVHFSDIQIADIHNLSIAVNENTKELLGEFPSNILSQAINLVSTFYSN
ncbi:MAG: hypothetical protein HeimC2_08600 [Candidatus Heimdallarchaeota archaeon LC_2]|nr:MAG: hypothetical protein HeimC2_08600 [Candidatus Heimdallarchaeota archaeon LC_2]